MRWVAIDYDKGARWSAFVIFGTRRQAIRSAIDMPDFNGVFPWALGQPRLASWGPEARCSTSVFFPG